MNTDEFERAARELKQFADYLYFHVMGEPLLHPALAELFEIANRIGFRVILTTNGTLLRKNSDVLLSAPSLHKVSVSLHAYEANSSDTELSRYLSECFDFCKNAADKGIISVLRLWNIGGEDTLNEQIIAQMHEFFDGDTTRETHETHEWKPIYSGYKIRERVFLEWGERFDWPDTEAELCTDTHSCFGLRDQVGVLCDGTVVPCCLDADGAIPLGNIFTTPLADILSSDRAVRLKKSFETRRITEDLCRRCGYGARIR